MTTMLDLDLDTLLPASGLVPGPDQKDDYRDARVTPPAGPAYAYNLILPVGWRSVTVPSTPGMDDMGPSFTGIGIFSPFDPPVPPVILSVGARLFLDRSTVVELFEEHCEREGYEILIMRPQRYAAGAVVEGLAIQPESPMGPMKMRIAMFEDGGRLFGLSAAIPEEMYLDFIRPMSLAMMSFELVLPQGQRMPLAPDGDDEETDA